MLLGFKLFGDTNTILQFTDNSVLTVVLYILVSIIAVFSPIAGLLTDVKFSRYKVVACTSFAIIAELLISPFFMAVEASLKNALYQTHLSFGVRLSLSIIYPLIFVGAFVITVVIFMINALQFGMDQLHDSPTEDSILFIHWYVWIYHAGYFLTAIAWNLTFQNTYLHVRSGTLYYIGSALFLSLLVMSLVLLIASLCVYQRRKLWFLLEAAGANPYKLVYRVVKFASQHKVPLRRSAFTYCEDKFPSRLDLGKHKYGGPFTTKQVEDVKAFWGILKILVCIGPVFMLQTVIQSMLPAFAKHGTRYSHNITHNNNRTVKYQVYIEGELRHIFISNGLVTPLLIVVCIPLYLCLIRPRISYRIPGMLKRIGLGMVLMILSLATALAMDVVVHKRKHVNCMLSGYMNNKLDKIDVVNRLTPPLYQNAYFLISQYLLSGIINMLIDVGVLEFICSQSPYSMKGLLLGTFFSIRTLFQGIAIMFILPFGLFWHIESLSCGSGFYLMYITIGVLELVLFTFMAKRYKYRTVNEPSNEYRYAEDYYSNIQ